MKLFLKLSILALIIVIGLIIIPNYIINKKAEDKLYNELTSIPKNRVGLILGASKHVSNGRINLYYKYRLNAAVKLFKAGKIKYILISGDNGRKEYDEPTDFKNDLISLGIPEDKIYLDYAGFRTLDSVIRAKEVFGINELTFISQEFHNERAIYLAENYNIRAIGFNAKDIKGKYGLKTKFREYLARTKASLDVLFNVQPKYLGEKIQIIWDKSIYNNKKYQFLKNKDVYFNNLVTNKNLYRFVLLKQTNDIYYITSSSFSYLLSGDMIMICV